VEKEIKRCTGACCRDFNLPYAPDEMNEERNKEREQGRKEVAKLRKLGLNAQANSTALRYLESDLNLVPDMVTYLGTNNISADGDTAKNPINHYRCNYHDPVSGNCTIYECRPRMCRDYPGTGGICLYNGCTRLVEGMTETEIQEKRTELKALL
jgi:Fe-S-cluster containining protein